MKRKIKYSGEPIGTVEIVNDFLPAPEQLAFQGVAVKIPKKPRPLQKEIK
ncbi:MAG: hypothetical protein FD163_897 [Hyphomonadaceae bacterium]|nr:MAG: hypothetical protein FD128_520 [Hyphomonadaceae bacterium]KAF0186229.1 MAG: hypothetical protein FD163_897 [Hyphomonadaceae bacterium]